MKGLEYSREYYNKYGKTMLDGQFSDIKDRIAVGVVGEGSECLGFDDEISRDHDFDFGFCMWLTEKDYEGFGFKLERAYSKLPREFMGLTRDTLSPVGGKRRSVMTIGDFYTHHLGTPSVPESLDFWLYTPSYALLNASNGEVFADSLGSFSSIRERILCGYPEDIRLKKLAGHTLLMAQSGQYNYNRLLARGERGGAQLAIFEFVRHAISAVYLLNNSYEPFYKWAYRGLLHLDVLSDIGELLTSLCELDNSKKIAAVKSELIEDIASMFAGVYREKGLSSEKSNELERHAYMICDKIRDPFLRNMNILEGI